jgi:electron transfer flavoprotein alpha subunit
MTGDDTRRKRRDPFAERGGTGREGRKRIDRTAGAEAADFPSIETEALSRRLRKDPFADRVAMGGGGRKRIDRTAPTGQGAAAAGTSSERVRKDPFEGRAAGTGGRKRIDRTAPAAGVADAGTDAASGRVRKDPFAARGESGASGRKRVDRSAAVQVEAASSGGRTRRDPHADRARRRTGEAEAVQAVAAPSAPTAPRAAVERIKTVDSPACHILVVPDLDDGRLTSHDRDTLGAARILADGLGGAAVAVVFAGPDGPRDDLDLGAAGADRAMVFADAAFAGYAPEARAAAVAAAAAHLDARHVLLPDTAVGGGDLGRRLAVLLGDRAAGDVQRVAKDRVVRRGGGGRSDFEMAPPRVLLIANEAADPVMDDRYEARSLDPAAFEADPRIEDGGLAATDPNAVPLAEADFIVSAGNGISDWEAFHETAAALGATEGGSRVVCDAGLLPRFRQVGASGTLVEPRCYLALGIAGAPQHLQGIQRCERVVAVNTDLYADMVKRADLSIILDAQQVMPALARIAREKRHGA